MDCENCGEKLPDDSLSCDNCGALGVLEGVL